MIRRNLLSAILLIATSFSAAASFAESMLKFDKVYTDHIRAGSQLVHAFNDKNHELLVVNDEFIAFIYKLMDGLVPDFHEFQQFLLHGDFMAPLMPKAYKLPTFTQFHEYLQTGIKGEAFSLDDVKQSLSDGKITEYSCDTCKSTVGWVRREMLDPVNQIVLSFALIYICWFSMNYQQCKGVIENTGQPMFEGFTEYFFEPNFFCKEVINSCHQPSDFKVLDKFDEVERILQGKPESIINNDYVNSLYKEQRKVPEDDLIKVVQITDVHLDYDYVEKSNAWCGMILCCHANQGFPQEGEEGLPAGPLGSFGTKGCDIPPVTFDKLIEKVKTQVDPDVVLWTGDIVPHDIWNQQLAHVEKLQKEITEILTSNFGEKASIYPMMGNHDFEILNSHDMTQVKSDRALNATADIWTKGKNSLIFEEDQAKLFADWGYYSLPFQLKKDGKDLSAKGRVIVLNTQACYTYNMLLPKSRQDPGGQLAWLEDLLASLEKEGQFAIVLGHVPFQKEDCGTEWAMRVRALFERYQHVIRYFVHGHSHLENIQVARSFDIEDHNSSFNLRGQGIGVHYTSGSVSTFEQVNPTFRVFYCHPDTMLPVKIDTYKLDISGEDQGPQGEWYFDHSIPEALNITDLSPASLIKDFGNKIIKDEQKGEEAAIAFENMKSNGGWETRITTCNMTCRVRIYCQLVNSVYSDVRNCQGLENYDFWDDPMAFIQDGLLVSPWYVPAN